MDRTMLILAAGLMATALAGCAAPDESAGDDANNANGLDDLDVNDVTGGNDTGASDSVVIDGRVYTCDDTLSADGVCDEYALDEEAQASADMRTATSEADGRVTIDGQAYECGDTDNADLDVNASDDGGLGGVETTAGACELYERAEE